MEQLSQITENSHFFALSGVGQTLLASCSFATGLVKHLPSERRVTNWWRGSSFGSAGDLGRKVSE
jgi:hypothetical protein